MRRFPFYSLIASALSLWVFGILFGNWEENVGNLGSNVFGMFGLNVGLRPTSPILYNTYKWNSLGANFFNMTITYREDGDVFYPHGFFMPRPDKVDPADEDLIWTEQEISEKIAKKKKLALWIVSNCETDSLRELYVKELAKHMDISQFGGCNNNKIAGEQYNREMEEHYFYLSFENSVCHHYITEKFWFPLTQLTVPVVLSRSPFQGRRIPSSQFLISADQFGSPSELAIFLKTLANDGERYRSYFNWTQHWLALHYGQWTDKIRQHSTLEGLPCHPYCRLCEFAHRRPMEKMVDFHHFWWEKDGGGGACISEFVRKKLGIYN